jgi:ribosomal-protein-alanine N-acetyltransferase
MSAQARPAPAVDPRPPLIHPMTVSDLDTVSAVEVQAYPFPWTRGNFIDSLAAGYHARCLWSAQRQLLGYLVAMHSLDEWHLLNITVAPAVQGQGHARALLRYMLSHGVQTGAQSLWLEVRPSNERARKLYLGFDFVAVGLRRGYYPAEAGQREDALVMRRNLGQDPTGGPGAVE